MNLQKIIRFLLVWLLRLLGLCIAIPLISFVLLIVGIEFYKYFFVDFGWDKTHLHWPRNAHVIFSEDTHGGFHGDGDFSLVFDTDGETIHRWISSPAPWQGQWSYGPLRLNIFPEAKTNVPLRGKNMWYTLRERSPSGSPLTNYDLLVIDAESNRVWLIISDS